MSTPASRALGRTLTACVCAAALLPAAFTVRASHVGEDLTTDQQAVAAADLLLSALRQYERAPAAQREAQAQRLAQRAAARKERMLALLERNPALAALRAMPAAARERLPAAAQAHVERQVGLSGVIQARIEDDIERGVSRRRLFVADAAGTEFEIVAAAASEREQLSWVGRRARVAALQFDRRLLALDKSSVMLAADGTTTTNTTASTSTVGVTGVQNTLVILGNFSDKAVECSPGDVQARLFGSTGATMDQAYRQSSNGTVSFTGRVIGPVNLPYASTGSCDPNAWAAAANAAAVAAGFNPSSYSRISYALPRNPNCPYAGVATLGGQAPTASWVMQCSMTGLFSHEIGHNLMFHHASTPSSEYGDSTDPMGGMMNVQFNAPNRVMAGWTSGTQVIDVSSSGSWVIDALENGAGGQPLVLRLPKADTGEHYYVSLRRPIGNDTNLPLFAQNALSVHHALGALPARTVQVANLAAGKSWTDSVNGITVTHQSLSSAGAGVTIAVGGNACVRAQPSVSIAPASQTAAAGGTLAYSVSLRNNNSVACPSSTFALSQALPAGWGGALSASALALAPGGSAAATWSITSPVGLADASYTLSLSASETTAVNTASVHAGYTVLNPVVAPAPAPQPTPPVTADTTAPQVAIASPLAGSTITGGKLTISAAASDASGVAAVEIYVDGRLLVTDTSAPYTASWNLRREARGPHTVRVRARDNAGNSAETSVQVTLN